MNWKGKKVSKTSLTQKKQKKKSQKNSNHIRWLPNQECIYSRTPQIYLRGHCGAWKQGCYRSVGKIATADV